MVSPSELSRQPSELLPNLGDAHLDKQRDILNDLYSSQGLIDSTDPSFRTEQPLADIFKMRYAALGEYVDSVKERMRHGIPLSISVPEGTIDPLTIFERLEETDAQVRDTLLTRIISRERLPEARRTGSDRDGDSSTGYHGGEYEELAMKEYAITATGDITYVSLTKRSSPAIKVSPNSALLVYAPEALQEISPKSRHIMGSSGLHAFIDPRLKWQSLLATVETSQAPNYSAGKVAVAYGTSWRVNSTK